MTARRLAIIGPFTWDPLVPQLEAAIRQYGLEEEVVAYGFGRDVQVWSGSDPEFESRPPHGAIVVPDANTLFQQYLADPRCDRFAQEQAEDAAGFLTESIRQVSARHPGISWVIATAEAPLPNSGDGLGDPALDPFTTAVAAFNARLIATCRQQPGWSVFDRTRLSSLYGSAKLYDPRMSILARFPASLEGMRLLSERLAAHWAAVRGKTKKVLVLDCDNTLWGGIVGEDGVNGIQIGADGIGRAYTGFQEAVLALESRGTLLAICSRNNPQDVEEVFQKRPEMLIPWERVAAKHIGWGPKSEGLRSLADLLGLGLDSFVFVDDSPFEREAIRHALPEVTVPEFPQDPADLPALGYELGWRYFYRLSLSEEDRRKTQQYRARARVEAERARRGDSDEFLKSLQMTARIAQDSVLLIHRNAQLSQKTNQFNLTLRRYTESDVEQMTADPNVAVFSASLEDRFSNHGWVALAILKMDPPSACWRFDVFLVSCRVLGRGFEQCALAAFVERARAIKNVPIRGEYIPGPKNAQTSDFFDKLGFTVVREDSDGSRLLELGVDDPVKTDHLFFEVAWEEN